MFTELAIVTLVIFCYQIVKTLTYWKRNGVPQFTIAETFKLNFEIAFQGLSQKKLYQKYTESFPNYRYFGVYQAFQKCLIVQDPELIKQITVKDFDHFVDHAAYGKDNEPLWDRNVFALQGKEWKQMRITLDTGFTSSKMKIMFNLLQDCCKQFVDYFKVQTKDQLHSGIDIRNAYGRFATDVIAILVFGYKCDSLKNPTNDFYVKSSLLFPDYDNIFEVVKRFLLQNVPKLGSFFGARFYAEPGSTFFRNLTSTNVQEREKTKIVRCDIVQALMEAKEKNANLSDIDIAAQTTVFFFAGAETIASSLCFISYELATHKDIQQRLQMEIDEVMKNCQGTVTFSALQEMKYVNMVVSESLRKWPPLFIERVCSKPYVIQPQNSREIPVKLNKGDILLLPTLNIHRNPNIFSNPDEFDPERFNDENKSKINPYAYSPFGVGPRTCVAKRFALMEMKLLLVHILSKFDIVTVDKTVDPNEFGNITGLTISINEFWLGFRPRTDIPLVY